MLELVEDRETLKLQHRERSKPSPECPDILGLGWPAFFYRVLLGSRGGM